MATRYYLNLNYVCNERCVFCASDLTGAFNKTVPGRQPWVTLDEIRAWVGDDLPGPGDRVMLAGGEPTLHRELFDIVRFLGADCRDVTLFTNGLRFANPEFARGAVEAGITRIEIALFGATPASHDAITRVPGSFERTLRALGQLSALRADHEFTIEVRLLFSRQSTPENPDIVRVVRERAPRVDAFSLNRLILSDNARGVEAIVAWPEARAALNEATALIREGGYTLVYDAIPLCLFDGDNAAHVRADLRRRAAAIARGDLPPGWEVAYFDAAVAAGVELGSSSIAPLATPEACRFCDARPFCGRIEAWYHERHGAFGLRPIRLRERWDAAD